MILVQAVSLSVLGKTLKRHSKGEVSLLLRAMVLSGLLCT